MAKGNPRCVDSVWLEQNDTEFAAKWRGACRRAQPLMQADIPLDGASDHGVSEALYLRDPDENGIELYSDRPEHNGRALRKANLPCTGGPSIRESLPRATE